MIRQPAHVEARRPPLRGICLVVKGNLPAQRPKPSVPVGMTAKFPPSARFGRTQRIDPTLFYRAQQSRTLGGTRG